MSQLDQLGLFRWKTSNVVGVRPSTANGTLIVPGNNAFGSWVEVLSGATVARDVWGLLINFNSAAVLSAGRDCIADVGVDPSGGSSYTVLIPNLLGSSAGTTGFGIWYYFPIWIKAGSSVAVRGSVNNATVGDFRVVLTAFGSPKDRTRVRVGTYVTAYGITAASSSGTAITPGTTSDGAWTSTGTLTRPGWWFQLGIGINNSNMQAQGYTADLGLGDSSNKFIVIDDQAWATDTSERTGSPGTLIGCGYDCPSGVEAWLRMQCSGTPDTGISGAVYVVGG